MRVHAEQAPDGVSAPRTYAVINFYHLADIAKPGETAARHKEYIKQQGWDIRGRIYISFQGVNAQFSGPREDALAYTSWVASQPEFNGVVWREYPVGKQMFPKLRLKFRPNLISLRGGMEGLPVTGVSTGLTPPEHGHSNLVLFAATTALSPPAFEQCCLEGGMSCSPCASIIHLVVTCDGDMQMHQTEQHHSLLRTGSACYGKLSPSRRLHHNPTLLPPPLTLQPRHPSSWTSGMATSGMPATFKARSGHGRTSSTKRLEGSRATTRFLSTSATLTLTPPSW